MGFHGAGAARAEGRGPAAGTMIGEWRWLLAAVWSRLRDDGLGTAPVTLCLLAGIALLAALQFLGVGQPLVTACCAPAAHQPWWQALARLPGSTVAPAQSLPASGALLQVLLVVGAAEMLIGSRAVVAVGLAAQCVTTAAARLMYDLGPTALLGMDRVSAGVRDTGPSAVVVAVGVYAACRLRLSWLLSLVAVAMIAEVVLMPNLAGREHVVAVGCGLVAARVSRSGLRRSAAGPANSPWRTAVVRRALVGAVALITVAGVDGVSAAADSRELVTGGSRGSGAVYVVVVASGAQVADPHTAEVLRRPGLTLAVDAAPARYRSWSPGVAAAVNPLVVYDTATGVGPVWESRRGGSPLHAADRLRTLREQAMTGRSRPGRAPPSSHRTCVNVVTPQRPAPSALLLGRLRHVRFVVAARTITPAAPPPARALQAGEVIALDLRAVAPPALATVLSDTLRSVSAGRVGLAPLARILSAGC